MAHYGLGLFCIFVGVQIMTSTIGLECPGSGPPDLCKVSPCQVNSNCEDGTTCKDYYCVGCGACCYLSNGTRANEDTNCPLTVKDLEACRQSSCESTYAAELLI